MALLLLILPLAGQAEDFRADLAALRQFLDTDRAYGPTARQQAEAEFEALQARAADLSPAAFQLALAQLAALARNGHTLLMPGPWAHQFPRTPLAYQRFADGLFVIHAPPPWERLQGAQVLAIEGQDLGALQTQFARYCGALTGKCDEWLPLFLESPPLLHAAGLAAAPGQLRLSLRLADGSALTQTLDAALDPPRGSRLAFFHRSRLLTHAAEQATPPLYLAEPQRWFRLQPLPELDALYLQLRANVSVGEHILPRFLAEAESTLQRSETRHLILDLRLNGGGDLNLTRAFMQSLPARVKGQIFVLSSARTFSAAITGLAYLKQAGGERVRIVGEPVGDGLAFWAEGRPIELPQSKALLLPATERHDYQRGCAEPDCHGPLRRHPIRIDSLQPDIAAPLTHADYRAGRDPALEAVRRALQPP